MEKSPFRHPSEMPTHEQREPISARVPKSVKKNLEEVATKIWIVTCGVDREYSGRLCEVAKGRAEK